MTPENAVTEARNRIQTARESKARILDLGDLGLTELPAEIESLSDTLEVLALGWNAPVIEKGEVRWTFVSGRHSGNPDQASLDRLSVLINLRELDLFGCTIGGDLRWVSKLTELRRLEADPKRLTDLAPLGRLSRLQRLGIFGSRTPAYRRRHGDSREAG